MYNSTIVNKKKVCKTCRKTDYIFSKGNCKQCAIVSGTQKRVSEYEETEDRESLQNYIQDLDAIFSKYIRLKYADINKQVKCYTCPKVLPIPQIQNGHYIGRANMSTRFLEENCRPQCPQCNSKHEIDIAPFKAALELENKGLVDFLESEGRKVLRYSLHELKEKVTEYRFKFKLAEVKFKK